MIERFQAIATFLGKFKLLIVALILCSTLLLILSLIDNPYLQRDDTLIPSFILFFWCLTIYSFSQLFANVPAKPDSSMAWRARMAVRLRRGLLWILAVLMTSLSLAVVILTYELLRTL